MSVVLDASAILAVLSNEPGGDIVKKYIVGAIVSAVNLAEVASKLSDRGGGESDIRAVLDALGLEVAPFDESAAYASAMLRAQTRSAGLSLGDRACLALGIDRQLPILTADRAWTSLRIVAEIKVIREA